jgi:hypothetical protein
MTSFFHMLRDDPSARLEAALAIVSLVGAIWIIGL